jgi:hypothetical protein
MPGNGHPTSLSGMFVLPMAAFLSNHDPTVVFDYTQNFSNGHYSACLRLFGRILVDVRKNARSKTVTKTETLTLMLP